MLLEITENEAQQGCTKTITIDTPVTCDPCLGKGYTNQVEELCPTCQGHKKVFSFRKFDKRRFICDECNENGKVIHAEQCTNCGGSGKTVATKTFEVVIPAGTESGLIESTDIFIKVVPDTWKNSFKNRLPNKLPSLPALPKFPRKK